jgi:hypothetical protein
MGATCVCLCRLTGCVCAQQQYERERGRIHEIAATKKKIEDIKAKMDKFTREGQLDKVADLKCVR